MADESLFSPNDAFQLVSGHYVDLLNIKLMKCGGIANAWKIASIAETSGIACMVGNSAGFSATGNFQRNCLHGLPHDGPRTLNRSIRTYRSNPSERYLF